MQSSLQDFTVDLAYPAINRWAIDGSSLSGRGRFRSNGSERYQKKKKVKELIHSFTFGFNGRGERIRTSDLTVPNRALYQAEPRPDNKY